VQNSYKIAPASDSGNIFAFFSLNKKAPFFFLTLLWGKFAFHVNKVAFDHFYSL